MQRAGIETPPGQLTHVLRLSFHDERRQHTCALANIGAYRYQGNDAVRTLCTGLFIRSVVSRSPLVERNDIGCKKFMDDKKYEYNLHEILCLKTYGNAFEAYKIDDYDKKITEWAEREIIFGNESDTLLILASLNLDKKPDSYEVEHYLLAYMRENNIFKPSLGESSVIWLKIKTWLLLHAESSKEIELRLHQMPAFPLSPASRIASSITWHYYGLHEELFDDWGPEYPSKASTMSESAIISYVQCRLKPFYRILNNPDWAWLLAR